MDILLFTLELTDPTISIGLSVDKLSQILFKIHNVKCIHRIYAEPSKNKNHAFFFNNI
jgi:hypothetical protein